MFGKKKQPEPQTVDEAIQPFRQVSENLSRVMSKNGQRKEMASKRIKDAEVYLEEVKATEAAAMHASDQELEKAQRIQKALESILGEA